MVTCMLQVVTLTDHTRTLLSHICPYGDMHVAGVDAEKPHKDPSVTPVSLWWHACCRWWHWQTTQGPFCHTCVLMVTCMLQVVTLTDHTRTLLSHICPYGDMHVAGVDAEKPHKDPSVTPVSLWWHACCRWWHWQTTQGPFCHTFVLMVTCMLQVLTLKNHIRTLLSHLCPYGDMHVAGGDTDRPHKDPSVTPVSLWWHACCRWWHWQTTQGPFCHTCVLMVTCMLQVVTLTDHTRTLLSHLCPYGDMHVAGGDTDRPHKDPSVTPVSLWWHACCRWWHWQTTQGPFCHTCVLMVTCMLQVVTLTDHTRTLLSHLCPYGDMHVAGGDTDRPHKDPSVTPVSLWWHACCRWWRWQTTQGPFCHTCVLMVTCMLQVVTLTDHTRTLLSHLCPYGDMHVAGGDADRPHKDPSVTPVSLWWHACCRWWRWQTTQGPFCHTCVLMVTCMLQVVTLTDHTRTLLSHLCPYGDMHVAGGDTDRPHKDPSVTPVSLWWHACCRWWRWQTTQGPFCHTCVLMVTCMLQVVTLTDHTRTLLSHLCPYGDMHVAGGDTDRPHKDPPVSPVLPQTTGHSASVLPHVPGLDSTQGWVKPATVSSTLLSAGHWSVVGRFIS